MVEILGPNAELDDNFGVAHEINKFTDGSIFGLWKLLYSTANTAAERTMVFALFSHRVHRGIEDAALLIRAGTTGPRTPRLYGSVDDFQTPEAGGQKHTLDNLLTGHSSDRVDALKFLLDESTDEKYQLSLLVEESPSLRLFLRLTAAARAECFTKLYTVDVQRHIDRARQVIQIHIPNGIKATESLKGLDPIQQFLDQRADDVNALDAEVDNSTLGRFLPNLANNLKSLYSADSLRDRFQKFLPNAVQLRENLVALYDSIAAPGTVDDPLLQRILPVRSAVLFLQLYGISIQQSDVVPEKVDLSTVWSTIRIAVRRVIGDFDVQFAATDAASVDVERERRALTEMRRILQKLDLPYLPDEGHRDFAAWRSQLQPGQIGRPEFAQFFDQSAVSDLALKLSGSNLSTQFLEYTLDVAEALRAMSFEVVNGFLMPTAEFEMPELERTEPLSRDERVTAALQHYLMFYFEIWLERDVLSLGELTDLRLFFKQVVEARVRELAKVYLLWAKRTQHWQPADALMTAVMAGSEILNQFETAIVNWLKLQTSWPKLEALPAREFEALIYRLKILASPELQLREEITTRLADERGSPDRKRRRDRALTALLIFVFDFIPLEGNSMVGALTSWQTSLARVPVQQWLRVLDAAFRKNLHKEDDPKKPETQSMRYRLRQHLRDPEPQAVLVLESTMVDNLRGLDYSATLFDKKTDPELHILFDLFLKPLLSGLEPNAKLTHQSAKRADAQGSLGRAVGQISFAGIPFLPLVTTPYFEANERLSVDAQICKFIANWEARNQVEILSSRWPNKDFDTFRSSLRIDYAPATLQDISAPDPKAVVELAKQILERDADSVRFSDDQPAYLPMFVGPLADQMEIAFRSNWRPDAVPVDRASISAAYAADFGDDPNKWLGTVENIPDAVEKLANDARPKLKREDYIPPELLGLSTRRRQGTASDLALALAIRPYLGILSSQPQGGKMLTDLVRGQLAKGIIPDPVRAFSLVVKRQKSVVTAPIRKEWVDEANKNPEELAQMIASTSTPTSPFGFDLYLLRFRPEPRINELIGWALWDNRSPFRNRFSEIYRADFDTGDKVSAEMSQLSELLYLVTRSRHILSPIKQRGQMLMLRGLVDALAIDGRDHVITEPARTIQILEPRAPLVGPLTYLPVPRTAYPVPRNLIEFYELFEFEPAFPYAGERLKSDLTNGTFDPNEKELPRLIMRNVPEQADPGMTRRLGQVYRQFYDTIAQYFSVRPEEPIAEGEVNVEPSFVPETAEELQERQDDWRQLQWSVTPAKAGDPQIPLLFLPSIDNSLEDLSENPDLRRTDETGGQKPEPVEAPIPAQPALAFQTEYRLLYSLMGGL